ncbi:hypothetical protein [Methylocella sp.]|uniref:hypothetical protein n=1 Tax=Methylocella sp. TaxID=1978226 RepID=UPI0035B1322D
MVKLVPSLLWFGLALAALLVFAKPALRLLNEGRITKVGVGIVEVDIAQEALANIKAGAGIPKTAAEFKPIADRAKNIQEKLTGSYVLWVDDNNPSQNVQERRALESFGIKFDLASSTDEAVKWLDRAHYDAVISDISRPNEPTNNNPCFAAPQPAGAGCAMTKTIYEKFGDDMPPIIFYSANFPKAAGTPPYSLGVTDRVDQLFGLVFDALERRKMDEAAP